MASLKPCYRVVNSREDFREDKPPDAEGSAPPWRTRRCLRASRGLEVAHVGLGEQWYVVARGTARGAGLAYVLLSGVFAPGQKRRIPEPISNPFRATIS